MIYISGYVTSKYTIHIPAFTLIIFYSIAGQILLLRSNEWWEQNLWRFCSRELNGSHPIQFLERYIIVTK